MLEICPRFDVQRYHAAPGTVEQVAVPDCPRDPTEGSERMDTLEGAAVETVMVMARQDVVLQVPSART
jgi:hypothetical protein